VGWGGVSRDRADRRVRRDAILSSSSLLRSGRRGTCADWSSTLDEEEKSRTVATLAVSLRQEKKKDRPPPRLSTWRFAKGRRWRWGVNGYANGKERGRTRSGLCLSQGGIKGRKRDPRYPDRALSPTRERRAASSGLIRSDAKCECRSYWFLQQQENLRADSSLSCVRKKKEGETACRLTAVPVGKRERGTASPITQ